MLIVNTAAGQKFKLYDAAPYYIATRVVFKKNCLVAETYSMCSMALNWE